MDKDSRFILRKVFLDIVLLACVGFPILFFFLWGKPNERGFFCDDESLRHPFHPSTVTSAMLYTVGLGLPILLMFVSEYINHRGKKNHKVHHFMGYRIPPWIWASYNVVGVFGFGVACQQLTTDIAKYTVGRLRPHFFSVCQPNINCNLEENRWRYITNFTCNGADDHLLKEMRLSFPSGHSSFSTFTMIYVAVYLQCRLRWSGSKLLRHGIQFVFLMLAWYTVLSRISDYKHHWSDVLGGACIGVVSAMVIFGCVSDLWKTRLTPVPRLTENNEDFCNGGGTSNGSTVASV